jgi:hypothetical protein
MTVPLRRSRPYLFRGQTKRLAHDFANFASPTPRVSVITSVVERAWRLRFSSAGGVDCAAHRASNQSNRNLLPSPLLIMTPRTWACPNGIEDDEDTEMERRLAARNTRPAFGSRACVKHPLYRLGGRGLRRNKAGR